MKKEAKPMACAGGLRVACAALACLVLAACMTVGRDFPAAPVPELQVGRTTQQEVRRAFGAPWRTGMEDGKRTWTYGHYRYSLLRASRARDLVLKFDDRGVLFSYTYSSTEPDL